MDSGGVDLLVDGRSWVMDGEWFWSCYPGPRIQFQAGGGHTNWSHRYLAFKGPLVERWRKDGLYPVHPRKPPASRSSFAAAFDRILNHVSAGEKRSTLRAIHELEGMLLDLSEPIAASPAKGEWLSTAASAIEQSLGADPLDYDALAESAGVSPSTFRRRFFERYAVSPHGYLLQHRINSARQMLTQTNYPLKKIATDLGYKDVSFFSRQFAKVTGVPPASYRRSRLG